MIAYTFCWPYQIMWLHLYMILSFAYLFVSVCTDGDIRLVDGLSEYEGRVEVCIATVWGTVCNNQWDSTDASVACGQLGYSEDSKRIIM